MASEGTTRRGRPTAEDARLKLAQVLAVAREQFIELGYRAVTMRGVAEKADVSTRTLYNRYADKLSLFAACLDFGAVEFPQLHAAPEADVHRVLTMHAAAIVKTLALESSLRLGMLVYREGGEFPELARASEENQDRYLVQPLAAYFDSLDLARGADGEGLAKLFIAMALSEWQRSVVYRHPMPTAAQIERHAAFVASTFLSGVRVALQEGAAPS